MKEKLLLAAVIVTSTSTAWAGPNVQELPEPSTLTLFAAATVAITVFAKWKK